MVKLSDLLVDKSPHRARTTLTSFGGQFDFHDVIYHTLHCNVDNRRRNAVLTTIGLSKCT